jgi:outer membrane protein OmpA-like peptidoglycan-associated protein
MAFGEMMIRKQTLGGLALIAAMSAISAPSQAEQPSLALDRFDPSQAGDRMFAVPSPFVAGSLTPHFMVVGDYAHNPLLVSTAKTDKVAGAVVGSQLFLHVNATVALWNRINVNVNVPVAVQQSGDNPGSGAQAFVSPSTAQIGDLRVGARLRIFGDYADPFQLAIGGSLWLPTGSAGAFVSDGKVRGMPHVIVGGRGEYLVWSFMAGMEFRPSHQFASVAQGSMVRLGGGMGFVIGKEKRLQIGPEVNVALTVDDVSARTSNVEALLDARYRVVNDFEVGLGAGPGLSKGIGTPDFRGVVMLAYTPRQKESTVVPPKDRDRDGIFDPQDACPDEPGLPNTDPKKNGCPPPKDSDRDGVLDMYDACPMEPGLPNQDPTKNGCPPRDRDKDTIFDEVDACPDVPGVANQDAAKNGCPPDTDEDGIPDDKDACPKVKGVASPDPKQNGCPPDTDGDGIPDDKDACPNEKGKPNTDPKKNGCPNSVRVVDSQVVILEQVQFDTGKATIKPVSEQLLDEVAAVVKEHPEFLRLEVQGHTDSAGSKALNRKLSQARAEAVKNALIGRGIAESRLTARGYGPDQPIGNNKTADGRQTNRRVQFKSLEIAPKK